MEKKNENLGPSVLYIDVSKPMSRMSEVNFNKLTEYKSFTEPRKGRKKYISLDALKDVGIELSSLQLKKIGILQ